MNVNFQVNIEMILNRIVPVKPHMDEKWLK